MKIQSNHQPPQPRRARFRLSGGSEVYALVFQVIRTSTANEANRRHIRFGCKGDRLATGYVEVARFNNHVMNDHMLTFVCSVRYADLITDWVQPKCGRSRRSKTSCSLTNHVGMPYKSCHRPAMLHSPNARSSSTRGQPLYAQPAHILIS